MHELDYPSLIVCSLIKVYTKTFFMTSHCPRPQSNFISKDFYSTKLKYFKHLKDTDHSKWVKSNLHHHWAPIFELCQLHKNVKISFSIFQVCTNRDEFNCFRIEPTTIAASLAVLTPIL